MLKTTTRLSNCFLRNSRSSGGLAWRGFSEAARSTLTDEMIKPRRQKHKVPQKRCILILRFMAWLIFSNCDRASKLLNELKYYELEKLKNGREWPRICSGDAIEIKVIILQNLIGIFSVDS